jgi:hypothetical protein
VEGTRKERRRRTEGCWLDLMYCILVSDYCNWCSGSQALSLRCVRLLEMVEKLLDIA